jgi:hypothetical protein
MEIYPAGNGDEEEMSPVNIRGDHHGEIFSSLGRR